MNFDVLKERMITEQLIMRGIKDQRVIDAFKNIDRHKFVPARFQSIAYADCPLSIGEGQTISQPYMVALMTELLSLKGNEKVLEIGTGSGYQTAILAELAEKVYSIERLEVLAKRAMDVLSSLGYRNIHIKIGDGTIGWEEYSPYDSIIITAGAPHIPTNLISQLKNGGKMVIPVGGNFSQTLTLIEKKKDRTDIKEICSCVFVPLVGKEGWRER